jgi:hypothetical protein
MKVCAKSVEIGKKHRRFPANDCVVQLRIADSFLIEAILACHRVRRLPNGGSAAKW